MKLWQKIFLPTVTLTMIGIFAISMGLIIRNHTIQLETEKDDVLSRGNEVITKLNQAVEDRKRGKFLASSILEELLETSCSEMSDENTDISVQLLNTVQDFNENTCFTFSEKRGTIQFQTIAFISDALCKVSISRNIQPMLDQFQEDIYMVQKYGILVSLTISIAMLILAIAITKPIKSLAKATGKISAGDYSYRITYKGSDELSELAQHMNDMVAHIEADTAYIEGISDSRRKFIANMTHELKTPLTSILGFADVLRIKPDLSEEEKKDYADIIFAEANRLRTLSSRLMELITIDELELHMTPVNIADLIMREVKMYRPVCEEANISLATDVEPAIIEADETLFATMLVNLMDNARKASEPDKEILVCCKKKADYVLVQVKDYGIGIPEEQITYVTEAFYMVDKARTRKAGGAGIGLALCKAVATAHQGELSIKSKPGEGTIVTVSVPLYREGE